MMPVRESLTFECVSQFELWLYAMGATKRPQKEEFVCEEGRGKEIKGRRRGSAREWVEGEDREGADRKRG